jgi:hypothetical protein
MFHKDSHGALWARKSSIARANALAAAKQTTTLKSEPYEDGLYKRAHKDRMMIAKIGPISSTGLKLQTESALGPGPPGGGDNIGVYVPAGATHGKPSQTRSPAGVDCHWCPDHLRGRHRLIFATLLHRAALSCPPYFSSHCSSSRTLM